MISNRLTCMQALGSVGLEQVSQKTLKFYEQGIYIL